MNARAADLRAKGHDVVAFGVGEPDFEPPRFVLDAAREAMDQGVSKYTAVSGIAPLRQAIAERGRAKGLDATPEQVTVTVGAKHALFNLAMALYEPGDEVVLPAPCWVSYPEQVRMMGATPVLVPSTEAAGWKVAPAALAAAMNEKTKAVILCTPSNPTGAAYTKDELAALLEVVAKHDAWLIVDEIYSGLVYDGFTHVSAAQIRPDLQDRLVIVDGVAKSYAMTGWRIGWCISPKPLAKILDTVQGQSTTNATAIAQKAALAAITGPQDEVLQMRDAFQVRRNVMLEELAKIPGVSCSKPEGAFYAFPDVRAFYGLVHEGKTIATDEDVAFFLLDKAHVATVPGAPFGAPGYLRLSYATSEARIREGVARIREAVKR